MSSERRRASHHHVRVCLWGVYQTSPLLVLMEPSVTSQTGVFDLAPSYSVDDDDDEQQLPSSSSRQADRSAHRSAHISRRQLLNELGQSCAQQRLF